MNFSGELTVPAPRGDVFAKLQDAPFFASCVDGVSDLEQLDDSRYSAVMTTRVAYMRFRFDVTVELVDVEAPQTIRARIEGKPKGIIGQLTADAVTTLHDGGAQTVIRYEVEAALSGKLGSLGQPVLKAKAREMERQFAGNLRAAFEAQGEGEVR